MVGSFNPDAEKHPCAACEYGGVWTDHGVPSGNTCKHPIITAQKGRMHGLYFTTKRRHRDCPLRSSKKKPEAL